MTTLEAGSKAPSFSGLIQDGSTIQLSDYKGKIIVLYFYPKDDTPGCTTQGCALRDAYNDILKLGAVVIGVSVDPVKSHLKFAEKFSLPFPLIADDAKKIVHDYSVWVEKSMYGRKYMGAERSTFIIDGNGVIRTIFRKVKPAEHLDQVLAALKEIKKS